MTFSGRFLVLDPTFARRHDPSRYDKGLIVTEPMTTKTPDALLGPLRIGSVDGIVPVLPAPMCGRSDRAWRIVTREMGCNLPCTEMIACEGLWRGDEKTSRLMDIEGEERPVASQLFGKVAESMAKAARVMEELGVSVIWPQLPLFDLPELAKRSRQLGLAVQLHPDRGDLMQRGKPQEVRDYVRRLVDTFGTASGGSWLYLEVDPGFPWANVEALFESAMELRR